MELKPARVTHPSKISFRELQARKWTLDEFGKRSGYPIERLDEDFCIDQELAEGCAKAFGTSAQFWLNLQSRWDE